MNLEFPVVERPLQELEFYVTDLRGPEKKRRTGECTRIVVRTGLYRDWHYKAGFRTPRIPWVGMLVAGGFLGTMLLCFNRGTKPRVVAFEEPPALIIVDWPKLEPEPEETSSDANDMKGEEGIEAPSLPDVPTSVAIESSFVQEIDYSSFRPASNVSNTSLSAIPAIIRHGAGSTGKNLKDLFNLADLDRIPEPVFQPIPKVTDEMLGGYTQVRATVEFIVTKTGEVTDAQIIDADTRRIGDIAASAITRWKFRPGIKSGRAVNTRMRQPLYFKVTGS
ncbi:MAG TPA: TonB family protein [Opitutaceae bacterium]|nr:TonB family protein [Opitutaceae bacterium]